MLSPWVVEERVAMVPVIGKLVAEAFPHSGIAEAKIRFGPHSQQSALLFWPEQPQKRQRSAVLFLHGGGWYSGSPQLFRFTAQYFAGLGYPTILGGYRLTPENRFPAQIQDVCASLETGLQAFAAHGVRVDRVIAGGQSAGANLAALLVYDRSRSGWNMHQEQFNGFFSISGPLSFAHCAQPDLRQMIADYMEGSASWDAGDPIRFIRGDELVPALLIHGDRDPLVDLENTLAFAARLEENPLASVQLEVAEGWHHADLVALFVEDLPVSKTLADWLERCDQD